MDIAELVKQFGFPIAVAIYFIWQNGKLEKEHKQDIRTIATQAIQALEKNTESDKAVTTELERNNTALEANNSLLSEMKGVLSTKGQNNGTRSA